MEYLQYIFMAENGAVPYWVLNLVINGIPSILGCVFGIFRVMEVLNLVINGIPSIQLHKEYEQKVNNIVLNLVINGIPSIHSKKESAKNGYMVLNLVINGIPSIQSKVWIESYLLKCFKPCYKWNTFNTIN